ncbi:MAG: radical SAM protein, partial [Candidatus Omnitrophica bacterium]|nr:radical SAM protein [Candidatus Omnitrophota bacterium]
LGNKAIHFARGCVIYNSSKAPKRTKKKFLSLAESLVYMHKKYRTETVKLYCFERFYHTPIKYRDSLQFIFKNNEFKIQEFKTDIYIENDCTAQIVLGKDFSKVRNTIEQIIPLIRGAHFEVRIVKTLRGRALSEFRGHFHQLIKVLRDNKKEINLEDIRRQGFLMGTRLLGPKDLSIDFHNRCNIQCLFCSINSPLMEKKKHVPLSLDLKFVKIILDQAHEMGVEKIRVSSDGEPLISQDAIPILKIIARKGFELQLLTNGTMLKEKHLASLRGIRKVNFLVNISAAKKTTYQKIHGGHADNYDFVLRALSMLLRFKQAKKKRNEFVQITTTYIITKLNYREISDYISLVKNAGVDNVYFKFAILYEEAEDLLVSKIEMRALKKELLKAKLAASRCSLVTNLNEVLSNMNDRGFQAKNDIKEHSLNLPVQNCYNGWFFGRINPFGDYYICCRETVPVGNVRKDDLKSIFFSRKMNDLLAEGASGISLKKRMWSKCNYCYHLHENRTAKKWLDQQ